MTVSDSSIETRVCQKCNEEKPLTREFWFARLNSRTGFQTYACRLCANLARRDYGRIYARSKRKTEEGRLEQNAYARKWKAANPAKIREARIKWAEKKGRIYGGRTNSQRAVERAYDRVVEKNARDAFKWWLSKKTDEQVAQWYATAGVPWKNHRLTLSQQWSVRYQADLEFNAREKARLYAKKMRRKHGITMTNDNTASPTTLIDARSCLYCGTQFDDKCKPTIDHMIPLTRGGTHSAANLVACCLSCNSRKGSRDYLDWLESLVEPYRTRANRAWQKLRGASPQQAVLI